MQDRKRLLDPLLRAATRVLARWLQRVLKTLEEPGPGIPAASSKEMDTPLAQSATPEENIEEAPAVAPAHWVEKVRRGAPHLLRPVSRSVPRPQDRAVARPSRVAVAAESRALQGAALASGSESTRPVPRPADGQSGAALPVTVSKHSSAPLAAARLLPTSSLKIKEAMTNSPSAAPISRQIQPTAPRSPAPGSAVETASWRASRSERLESPGLLPPSSHKPSKAPLPALAGTSAWREARSPGAGRSCQPNQAR
jgi:hypothetical protein